MKCHEFEDRLNLLLDERIAPRQDSVLAAHAAQCEACNQMLDGQMTLLAGLSSLRTPPLAHDFAECVVAQVVPPVEAVVVNSRRRSTWWLLGGIAAVAATLLLSVNVALVAKRNRDRAANLANQSPTAPAVRREAKPRPRGLATINPGPVGKQPKQLKNQPAGIARQPAPKLPDPLAPALTRPFSAYGMSLESMAANLPEAVEQLEEVERIAPGIRPIRLSFAMLWGALRRAIPGLHATEEQPTNTSSHILESWRVA